VKWKEPAVPASRLRAFTLTLILAAAAALYFSTFNLAYTGLYNDDARHILAARSLLRGSYENIFLPVHTPIDNLLPGYPMLIAPVLALGGITAVKFLSVLFMLAAICLLWLLSPAAPVAALIFALHPAGAEFAVTAMTEPAYVFWLLCSLYLLEKNKWRLNPALFIFCAFASWLRPEGFLFLLAAAAACAKDMERRDKMRYGLGALAFFALPYIRNIIVSDSPAGYFREASDAAVGGMFASMISTVKSNFPFYLQNMPSTVFINPLRHTPALLAGAVIALFWILFLRGILASLRGEDRIKSAAATYTVLLIGLQLLWVNHDKRYFISLLPFAAIFLLDGAGARPRLKTTLAVCAALLTLLAAGRLAANAGDERISPPERTFSWMRKSIKDGEYIMTERIESYALNTGAKGYPLARNANPDDWYYSLLERKVAYVVFDNHTDIASVPGKRNANDAVYEYTAERLGDRRYFGNVFFDPQEQTAIFKVTPPPGFEENYRIMLTAQMSFAHGERKNAIDRLMELDKKHVPLHRLDFVLGSSLLISGRAAEAMPYLERALQKEPSFETARQRLEEAKKETAGSLPRQTGN